MYNYSLKVFKFVLCLAFFMQIFVVNADSNKNVLKIRGVDAITQEVIKGESLWKIVSLTTDKVISISGPNSGSVLDIATLTEGEWMVAGISDNYSGLATISLNADSKKTLDVNMLESIYEVKINSDDEAVASTVISISWDAPSRIKAKINLQKEGEEPLFYAPPNIYTVNKKAPTTEVNLPSVPGNYVFRFYSIENIDKVIAERIIKLTPADIKIIAPTEAIAGTEIDVSWLSPKTSRAKINLKLADSKPNYNARYFIHTKGKNKDKLRLPSSEGDYVLRWYSIYDRQLILEHPIKVLKQEIKIESPKLAKPGEELEVSWQAPKLSQGKIILTKVDDQKKILASLDGSWKRQGKIKLPDIEGDFVLQWKNKIDNYVVTEKSIKLSHGIKKNKVSDADSNKATKKKPK